MSETSLNQMPLSSTARNRLKTMGIYSVEDLLNTSITDIAQWKKIDSWTLDEILKVVSQFCPVYTDTPREDTSRTYSHRRFSKYSREQLKVMADYAPGDLDLSPEAAELLDDGGYLRLDEIASLPAEELLSLRGAESKTVNEIIFAVDRWSKEKFFPDHKNILVVPAELIKCIQKISSVLTPVLQIDWKQLAELVVDAKMDDLLDTDSHSLSLEHNIAAVLTLPDLSAGLRSFWLNIAPYEIIEISDAKKQLTELHLSFDYHVIIQSSLKNHIICERDNAFLFERDSFTTEFSRFCNIRGSEDRTVQILKLRLGGMSLRKIGARYDLSGERVRQIISKSLTRFPLLYEDYFSIPFEYFDLSKEEFMQAFPNLSGDGYDYLSVRHSKGHRPLNEKYLSSYTGPWKNNLLPLLDKKAAKPAETP